MEGGGVREVSPESMKTGKAHLGAAIGPGLDVLRDWAQEVGFATWPLTRGGRVYAGVPSLTLEEPPRISEGDENAE